MRQADTIDSAPRDGTHILGLDGFWREMWLVRDQYEGEFWRDEFDSEPEPTHWVPLPDPSPRSDEGSGLTPSDDASSAIAQERDVGKLLPDDIANAVLAVGEVEWGKVGPKTDAEHLEHMASSLRITRDDFGTPEKTDCHGAYAIGSEKIICITGTSPNSASHARAIVGAWNHLVGVARAQNAVPTTSPSAISEAPTSADAVKTSPEVGEMVERLNDIGLHCTLDLRRQAASLLIALDAERGRLREALNLVLTGGNHIASVLIGELGGGFSGRFPPTADHDEVRRQMGFDGIDHDVYEIWCCWNAIMRARSALPASDEK